MDARSSSSAPGRRCQGAFTLGLGLVLVLLAAIGWGAVSWYRSSVGLRLDAVEHDLEMVRLAETAIAEVAAPARLADALGGPGLAELRSAVSAGQVRDGMLTPAPHAIGAEAEETLAWLQGYPDLTVTPVAITLLEYLPAQGRGRIRFTVTVSRVAAGRSFTRHVAQDHEVSLYEAGGALACTVSEAPTYRIFQ